MTAAWLGDAADTLRVWEFKTDWDTPANSTFGLNASYDPNLKITTANVDPDMCGRRAQLHPSARHHRQGLMPFPTG